MEMLLIVGTLLIGGGFAILILVYDDMYIDITPIEFLKGWRSIFLNGTQKLTMFGNAVFVPVFVFIVVPFILVGVCSIIFLEYFQKIFFK